MSSTRTYPVVNTSGKTDLRSDTYDSQRIDALKLTLQMVTNSQRTGSVSSKNSLKVTSEVPISL
jgi:hypothetical protein